MYSYEQYAVYIQQESYINMDSGGPSFRVYLFGISAELTEGKVTYNIKDTQGNNSLLNFEGVFFEYLRNHATRLFETADKLDPSAVESLRKDWAMISLMYPTIEHYLRVYHNVQLR